MTATPADANVRDVLVKQHRRLHGLQRPLHPLQVVAVVTFCAISFINFSVVLPLIEKQSNFWTLVAVEVMLTSVTVAMYLRTSLIDTADPAIYREDIRPPLYCCLCKSHVDTSSKHCQACNKCVLGFDHHCVWLNCCIGSHNYKSFVALLALSILLFSAQLSVALLKVVISYTHPEFLSGRLPFATTVTGVRVLLAIVAIVTLCATCLTGDLLCFHLILRAKGLTTYEYILAAKDEPAGPRNADGKRRCGTAAALCRRLPLCDSCVALCSIRQAPPSERAGISICRALGTTAEAGKQARQRRLKRGKVVPLSAIDTAPGEGHGVAAAAVHLWCLGLMIMIHTELAA
eukprot:jgi/Ulvmu1/9651/UM054_0083.1